MKEMNGVDIDLQNLNNGLIIQHETFIDALRSQIDYTIKLEQRIEVLENGK